MRISLLLALVMTACGSGVTNDPGMQCSNTSKDGNETDIDCGGGTCGACDVGKICESSADCTTGICKTHLCTAPPAECTDGAKNGFETDIDCGGGSCSPCTAGKICTAASDCATATCSAHVCSAPVAQCLDGAKNGSETDVDCGGGTCPVCGKGKACVSPADCATGSCVGHVCSSPPAQCLDDTKDGNETDIDCGGGTCPVCDNGRACSSAADCTSASCVNSVCSSPPAQCLDNMKDGNETDVDCGGGTCPACVNTKACAIAGDCTSGVCANKICTTPPAQCLDNMKDGSETDVDCGGGTCATCPNGKRCANGSDCSSGACNAGTCGASSGCTVTCNTTSCTCTATCSGHTYGVMCFVGDGCTCMKDGTSTGNAGLTGDGCTTPGVFQAYSASTAASGCGFPGVNGAP